MAEKRTAFSTDSTSPKEVFERVRAECDVSTNLLFSAARDYLSRAAKNMVDSDIRGQISESDLVQETLILANQRFDKFDGETEQQFTGWIRRIFVNNLISKYRAIRKTQKRDVTKERRIDVGAVPGEWITTASNETPSRVAIQNEESQILTAAMGSLSERHRKVIELRHREHLPFKEIGQRMNCNTKAARVLWYRAFQQLAKRVNQVHPRIHCQN